MKHDFRYFFREGIRNMFSHGFMSFAAIGVTVACLVIMGTFSLVAYNANENLKDLQKENAVLAFVDENLSDNEAKALQSTLEKIPGAADCTFVSRQEARDSYVEQYDEDDLYSNLDPSIFSPSVRYPSDGRRTDAAGGIRSGGHPRHREGPGGRDHLQRVFDGAECGKPHQHRPHCGAAGDLGIHYLQHHQAHHL